MKRLLFLFTLILLGLSGCQNNTDSEQGTANAMPVSSVTEDDVLTDDNLDASLSVEYLDGLWQTVSMGYEYNDTIQPEYYVQFTDTSISYGHMIDDAFVLDYSSSITLLEELPGGGYRIQAEADNGHRYAYQTSEVDDELLDYFATWSEDDYPETYSGGSSIYKCN